MVSNTMTGTPDTISAARSYGDWLIHELRQNWVRLISHDYNSSGRTLPWNNPENIDSGISGLLLLLTEIHIATEDPKYLSAALETAYELIAFCDKTPTGNYSLYTGRCGAVYALMHLATITGQDDLLTASLRLVAPANGDFLTSPYTTDYLYDGRAGTLLLIVQLFRLTRQPFLREYIDRFLKKIIENGCRQQNGIYWKNAEEVNLRPSCGFAYGGSGIAYVMSFIHNCWPEPSLQYLTHLIRRYNDSCWLEERSNWGDFSKDIFTAAGWKKITAAQADHNTGLYEPEDNLFWAKGFAGMAMARLTGQPENDFPDKFDRLQQRITQTMACDDSGSLYDGIPGLGLCLLQMSRIFRDERMLQQAIQCCDRCGIDTVHGLRGGLFHGEPGRIYALLKMTTFASHSGHILAPFLDDWPGPSLADDTVTLSLPELKKTMLSKYFPGTIMLLDTVDPSLLPNLLTREEESDDRTIMEIFTAFMEKSAYMSDAAPLAAPIRDVFTFEQTKYLFALSDRRSSFQQYVAERDHHDKMIATFNDPDDDLLRTTLVLSPRVRIVPTKWDWVKAERFGDIIRNLFRSPVAYEVLLRHSSKTIEQTLLGTLGHILHRFHEPKTGADAMAELKQYCHSVPHDTLKEFAQGTGSNSIEHFLGRLDFVIVFKIKEMLYHEVLIPSPLFKNHNDDTLLSSPPMPDGSSFRDAVPPDDVHGPGTGRKDDDTMG